VLVGTAADDIRLEAPFTAIGPNPYALGPRTTMGRIAGNPQAMQAIVAILMNELGTLPTDVLVSVMTAPLKPLSQALDEILGATLPDATAERRAEITQLVYDALAATSG